jgi:hypothetical protein
MLFVGSSRKLFPFPPPEQFEAVTLAEIASKIIPKRPGRIYPRTVKQWRNRFPMAPRGRPRQKSTHSNVVTILKVQKKERKVCMLN